MSNGASSTPIETARKDGRTTLTEAESKALFASTGINTPVSEVVESVDAAVDAAEDIGYPVVVKVSSPAIQHKSDWADGDGVALNLDSTDAVRSAAEHIHEAAAAENIEAGFLVEQAVDIESGTEIIIGGMRDPSFGPVVLTGLGGVFTEIFADTSHRMAPVDVTEARAAIEELQAIPLLQDYRGRSAADLDALAEAVRAIGDLLVEQEEVMEIDINPVLANPDGVIALDGLVTLTEAGE